MKRNRDWFQYPLLFEGAAGAGLTVGESQIRSVQVQNDHFFIWTHALAHVTVAAGNANGTPFLTYLGAAGALAHDPGPASWPVRCQILDAGSQLSLTNDEVPLSCIFGDGALGKQEISHPRQWAPNSTIQVTLRRFAAGQLTEAGIAASAANIRVHLVFEGYRVFDDPRRLNRTSGV